MGQTKGPKKPGKVLTTALRLGLSATVDLTRNRVTADTVHLLVQDEDNKGMQKIWAKALEEYRKTVEARMPSADTLQKAEHSIRRNFYKLIWNSAVRYGNEEVKRKRRQEDRKYLNILMDYVGGRIRDISMVRYPFSKLARIICDDGSDTLGYPGNARTPEYCPSHTSPELDFIDMIRSHLLELVRQCLKYNVPIKHAKKFIDDLINRLLPFLDYVYTERRIGQPHFTPEATKELRKVVLKIRSRFGKQNGRPQSITSSVKAKIRQEPENEQISNVSGGEMTDEPIEPSPFLGTYEDEPEDTPDAEQEYGEIDYEKLFKQLMKRCQVDLYPGWKKHVKSVEKLFKEKKLTAKDVEHLVKQMAEESRRVGKAFHDFIANAGHTHRPFTLYAPVRYGDKIVFEESGYLLTAEVSVAFGRGRVDLILFRRKALHRADGLTDDIAWEPCMVIEIKTKNAFNFDMYAVRTKSKDTSKRVVEFDLERRKLTDEEWDHVLAVTPIDYELLQLNAYSQAILSEYKRIAKRDVNPPKGLVKAVLVVDSKENWEDISTNLMRLAIDTFNATQTGKQVGRELFQCEVNGRLLRLGLVVFSNEAETSIVTPPEHIERFDPFRYSKNRDDDMEFILYLSISGKGSPSESAARIAATWHGLQYVHKLTKGKHRDVIWFDLSGEYSDQGLRESRFRLKAQPQSVARLVRKRVKFYDMSSVIRKYIHEDATLKTVIDFIDPILSLSRRPFIIITGHNMVRRSTPKGLEGLLNEFLIQFISSVPRRATVLWFDRPVPLSLTNPRYDIRCVAPFYNGSPWMYYVDEIVYNIQMPPPRFGSYASADDDARVLVIEHPGEYTCDLIQVDVLRDWGEKFRSDDPSERGNENDLELTFKGSGSVQEKRKRGRPRRAYGDEAVNTALGLLPHLYPPSVELPLDDGVRILRLPLQEQSKDRPKGPIRLSFAPFQLKCEKREKKEGERERVTRLEPLSRIDSRRIYRSTRLYGKRLETSSRPPHKGLLDVEEFELFPVLKAEISGMKRVIGSLEREEDETDEWKEFLFDLRRIVTSAKEVQTEEPTHHILRTLRIVRQFLETSTQSSVIWNIVKKERSWTPSGLSKEQYDHLDKVRTHNPDIFLITGNHLFLLVLAAIRNIPQTTVFTHLVEELWDYVQSWQLVQLGLTPKYHDEHRTGESVLHRGRIYQSLVNRAKILGVLLEKTHNVSNVRFGHSIMVEHGMTDQSPAIWLSCQSSPGGHEMDAILLSIEEDIARGAGDVLGRLVRDRPYWGESDITRLSQYADISPDSIRTPIMFAEQRGIRGLWVLDNTRQVWSPIGRVEYYTRKRETVTLIQSLTIRQDSSLQTVPLQDVRRLPSDLADQVDVALGLIRVAYSRCVPVSCNVSIDSEEKMFLLSFTDKQGGGVVSDDGERLQLLVKRTVDVLEVLRRPDIECGPVFVAGQQLVWNRFKDIEYVGDAFLLRQWVERKEPYKYTSISLPPTAEQFIGLSRTSGLKIRVQHDPSACPIRNSSIDELVKRQKSSEGRVEEYLKQIEGPEGQPDNLLNESIYCHGLCWRVKVESEGILPESVQSIEEVALGGPELRTLLETGSFVFQTSEDNWRLCGFNIPDPDELPREFRESIHLMQTRRGGQVVVAEPVFPGTYILEEWAPEIKLHLDKVEFRMLSQVTGEMRKHEIVQSRAEQMQPEKLEELLWKGMEVLLSELDLEGNERMQSLVQEEIGDHIEIIEEQGPVRFQYRSLSMQIDGSGGQVITATLVSDDGGRMDVKVTGWIHRYLDWTKLSGGIESTKIEEEVHCKLSLYDIDEDVIQEITDEVKVQLEERGVRFYEE
jgi:hypothetical protein